MNTTLLRQSLLIWFFTNLIGAFGLWIIVHQHIPFYALILMSMAFSIPAIILLFPALYILDFIYGTLKRIVFAITASLAICAIILMVALAFIPDSDDMAAELGCYTLPYVVIAPICFIVIVETSLVRRMKS